MEAIKEFEIPDLSVSSRREHSMIHRLGTENDFICNDAFYCFSFKILKLPHINGELESKSLDFQHDVIEFSQRFNLKNKEMPIFAEKILCPRSIDSTLTHFAFGYR